MNDFLKSRYNTLFRSVIHRLDESKIFSPRTEYTKEKKNIVYNNAKDLYNKILTIYYIDYKNIQDEKKRMGKKYDPKNLVIKGLKGHRIFEAEEKSESQREETIAKRVKPGRQKEDDSDKFVDIPDMPPLEGHEEEVKERQY